MLGLQQYTHRYSTPSTLRGTKLSLNEMNRTQSLKLRKVNEIHSARTRLPDHDRRSLYRPLEHDQLETNSLFFSHSKVLKRTPTAIFRPISPAPSDSLMIEANQLQRKQLSQSSESQQKEKIYFYSPNLDQNMNMFMNRMLNKSKHERKEKIRQIEEKINLTYLDKINASKNQNNFWRRMRRSISRKQRPSSREGNISAQNNKAMWDNLMSQ